MFSIPVITVTELQWHGNKVVKIPRGTAKIDLLYLKSSAVCS